MDQQAGAIRDQASARQAQVEADLAAHDALLTQDRARRDAMEQQQAARFAAGVAEQQAAKARLQPVMQACVRSNARRLATISPDSADRVVAAALRVCQPEIDAVARTVELAHLSSKGLAAEIAARLRPEVRRLVADTRASGAMSRRLDRSE